ncbi:Ger(x)C family spore germination protein [Paenibacillus polymyxa]|uniref:Ger(x)C family spore germination protein n=1 Tax=Paenibacillus polymyxa TaxID=1406 RepID=UPI001BEB375B|nr:Ger(x)C family spore germination protein [Paenibacillus polymyxa]MBT2285543.1 Ger(x)C family spore germination protein [Paenibacillus polymyxa]
MIRCGFVLLILFVSAVSISGCSGNRTELNDLGVTTATGFDRKNGNWCISYQIIVPPANTATGAMGGSQTPVTIFSAYGKTIKEALTRSSLENPKKVYFAHTNVILIGDEAAKYGIAEIMDNFYRNVNARETVKVIITDGEAKNYLKKLVPPEKQPGLALSEILERSNERGSYYAVMNLHEIALKITSDSGTAGIPILTVKGKETGKLESINIYKQTSTPAKLKLEGLSIFYKDKEIGIMNQSESMGVSWLTDQVHRTSLSYTGENGEVNNFLVRKANVKVMPIKSGQHYSVQVNVKANAELDESTSQKDLESTHNIQKMQLEGARVIKSQILTGWNASQRLRVDPMGIANKIHQRDPKYWKKIENTWPQELAQMDIHINVDFTIQRVGLLQNSFGRLLHKENEGEH